MEGAQGVRAGFLEGVAFEPAFKDWVRQSQGEGGLGGGNSLNKGLGVGGRGVPRGQRLLGPGQGRVRGQKE